MDTKRHAYLILAHKNPGQLRKLLSLLDDSRNDIYLHLDAKAPFSYESLQGCCTKAGLQFISPRIRVSWGGESIVRAEMALLQAAIRTPHSYYHLLSGLDLPLKSQDTIHRFFAEHDGREFIETWPLRDHTRKRVELYTPFPEGNHFFLTSWLNHAFKAVFRIRVNAGVDFHIGSQWFSITDGFARFICSKADWVAETFRHTGLCDEILIPTLLMMSPYRDNLFISDSVDNHDITMANARYICWRGSGSVRHPKTLGSEDLETLLSVPHLWARKFDESVSPEVIDKIILTLKENI